MHAAPYAAPPPPPAEDGIKGVGVPPHSAKGRSGGAGRKGLVAPLCDNDLRRRQSDDVGCTSGVARHLMPQRVLSVLNVEGAVHLAAQREPLMHVVVLLY